VALGVGFKVEEECKGGEGGARKVGEERAMPELDPRMNMPPVQPTLAVSSSSSVRSVVCVCVYVCVCECDCVHGAYV